MGHIKSYSEFLNENLFGQYSYYGAGSLFPIVAKLAEEGKTPNQIYLYLTTLGIDEERKRSVISKVFVNEHIEFDEFELDENELNEDELDDVLKLDPDKSDEENKKALDSVKKKDTEEDKPKEEEPKEEDDTDASTKIQALQSALKDAQKIDKIKKILSESLGFDIVGIEEEVLESVLEYHKVFEKLTPEEKAKLKDSDFIFPAKRSWPIHDEKHAKTALVWATWPQYKDIKNEIVKAVLKRYPNLKGVGAAK